MSLSWKTLLFGVRYGNKKPDSVQPSHERNAGELLVAPSGARVWPNGREPLVQPSKLYVASRASVPERSAMWRRLRDERGWPIVSTWINEAGEGESASMVELWARIGDEVRASSGLVLYVQPSDLPLRGAFVEVGMALSAGLPVFLVFEDPRGWDAAVLRKSLGSWIFHPRVTVCIDLGDAFDTWRLYERG